MATLALAAGGAALGGGLTGGSLLGIQVGFLAGQMLGNALFGDDQETTVRGPRLADLRVSSSAYGRPRPIVYGRMRVGGNIIWSTGIEEVKNKQSQDIGGGGLPGKGGGGVETTTVTYRYRADFAIALAEGPIDSVLRIWADGKLLYDFTTDGEPASSFANVAALFDGGGLRIYLGTETQEPDPLVVADQGIDLAPAYRNTCYLMFENLRLENFGNRIPQIQAEISSHPIDDKFPSSQFARGGADNGLLTVPGQQRVLTGVKTDLGNVLELSLADNSVLRQVAQQGDGVVLSMKQKQGFPLPTGGRPAAFDSLGNLYLGWQENGASDTGGVAKFAAETYGLLASSQRTGIFNTGDIEAPLGLVIGGVPGIPVPPTPGTETIVTTNADGSISFIAINPSGQTALHGSNFDDGFGSGANSTTALLPILLTIANEDIAIQPSSGLDVWQSSFNNAITVDNVGDVWFVRVPNTAANEYGIFKYNIGGGFEDGFIVNVPWSVGGASENNTIEVKYWADEDVLIIAHESPGKLFKVDATTGELLASIDVSLQEEWNDSWDVGGDRIGNPMPWAISPTTFQPNALIANGGPTSVTLVDLRTDPNSSPATFLQTETITFADWGYPGAAGNLDNSWYNWMTGSLWSSQDLGTDFVVMFLGRLDPESTRITLDVIVDDLSNRAGMVDADFDVTELASTFVTGFVVDKRMPVRRALEPLAQAYFFDGVESDFIIKYPLRGGSIDQTITAVDLGASQEDGDDPELQEDRIQEQELPVRVDITYADQTMDYQSNDQHQKRIDEVVTTQNQLKLDMPLALTDDEAKQIAEKTLYNLWTARENFSFSLGRKWTVLDPADRITVTTEAGVIFTMMVTEVDLGAGGVIEVKAVQDDIEVYTSAASGNPGQGFPPQTIPIAAETKLVLLDINALRDQDNALAFYLAGASIIQDDDTWTGATVFVSDDNVDFNNPLAFIDSSAQVQCGSTTDTLADGPTTIFDRTNTVTVNISGTLSSASELDVLNGSNRMVIGEEIIGFVNATLNADGTYTLDTLLRGLRGTEHHTADHTAGEQVVVPTVLTVSQVVYDDSQIDKTRYYRAFTGGGLPSAPTKTLTFQNFRQYPYSPTFVDARKDGSPGDLTITWQRRTRVGGSWLDGVDVQLVDYENGAVSFEVDILDPGSPESDVVRTLTATATANGSVVTNDADAPQAIYTLEDQVADFGAEQDTIFVRIYQRNDIVGRGHGSERLEVPRDIPLSGPWV